MEDRVKQMLMKIVLKPEWEAKLITKPSKEAAIRQKPAISRILLKYKGAPISCDMERLSGRIKEWTCYHSVTQSTITFFKLDARF